MTSDRNDFSKNSLEIENLHPNPKEQFNLWLDDYIELGVSENIVVDFATINKEGFPSNRIVYLRDIDINGLIFFTNYDSNKGEEIRNNNKASMLFYWPEFERQVRVWGFVEKVEKDISDNYFSSRPKGSQAGAWISRQSKEIPDRESLEKMHKIFLQNAESKIIPRPEFWGGYRLIPVMFEFWQGKPNRLHDRFLYKKNGENWEIKRLAP